MRRLLLSSTGWLLVLVGVALYPLPGPGLLVMLLGVTLLGRHDPWAAHRLEPLRQRVELETRRAVATWPRTLVSVATAVAIAASGGLWLLDPAPPPWWVLPEWVWLPGGTWSGVGQLVSGVVAGAVVVWARAVLVEGSGRSARVMKTLSGSGR